jgi:hypothetical protein
MGGQQPPPLPPKKKKKKKDDNIQQVRTAQGMAREEEGEKKKGGGGGDSLTGMCENTDSFMTRRIKSCGIDSSTPAPSPVFFSQPHAPRWSIRCTASVQWAWNYEGVDRRQRGLRGEWQAQDSGTPTSSIVMAASTVSRVCFPLRSAMNPTPQASRSFAGSYSPIALGLPVLGSITCGAILLAVAILNQSSKVQLRHL